MENAGAVQLCLGRLGLEMYAKNTVKQGPGKNMVRIVGKDDELLMVYISGAWVS